MRQRLNRHSDPHGFVPRPWHAAIALLVLTWGGTVFLAMENARLRSELARAAPEADAGGPAPAALSVARQAPARTTPARPPEVAAGEPAVTADKAVAAETPTGGRVFSSEEFSSLLRDSRGGQWRHQELQRQLALMADADIATALALVEKSAPASHRVWVRAALLGRWAGSDPTAAMAHADGLGNTPDQNAARLAVLNGWLQKDADGALVWARSLPAGNLRTQAMGVVIPWVARKDPAQALDMLRTDGMSNSAPWLIAQIFNACAVTDPGGALAKAEGLSGGQRAQALSGIAAGWVQVDPKAALAWVSGLPEGRTRREALQGIARHLGQDDPQAAVSFADKLAAGPDRNQFINHAVSAWAHNDAAAAVAWVQGLPDATAGKNRLLMGCAGSLGQNDPQAGLRIADSLPAGANRTAFLTSVVRSWANNDAESAYAWVAGQPDATEYKGQLQGQVLANWASRDAQAALAAVKKMPEGGERNRIVTQACQSAAGNDPAATAGFLALLPEGQAIQVKAGLVGNLAHNDPDAALKIMEALPEGAAKNSAWSNLSYSLGQNDPQKAVKIADTLPPGKVRDQFVANVAANWANNDAEGALAWLTRMPEGKARQDGLLRVLPQWANSDPEAAIAYAITLPADAQVHNVLNQMARTLAANDTKAAQDWVAKVPAGEPRDSFLAGVAAGLAQRSPEKAAAFVADMSAGKARDQAVKVVAQQWANSDPAAAAAWVAAQPDGEPRTNALQSILSTWTRVDAAAAARWIGALQEGKDRDAFLASHITATVDEYPASVARLVADIGDEKRRNEMIQRIARQWLKSDRSAAEPWLRATSLAEDQKEKLLQAK